MACHPLPTHTESPNTCNLCAIATSSDPFAPITTHCCRSFRAAFASRSVQAASAEKIPRVDLDFDLSSTAHPRAAVLRSADASLCKSPPCPCSFPRIQHFCASLFAPGRAGSGRRARRTHFCALQIEFRNDLLSTESSTLSQGTVVPIQVILGPDQPSLCGQTCEFFVLNPLISNQVVAKSSQTTLSCGPALLSAVGRPQHGFY